MTYDIRFDDSGLKAYLAAASKEVKAGVIQAVNKSAEFAKQTVTIELPKRAGLLRKSYLVYKTGELSREVRSTLAYADALEFGSKAKTIRPKRSKMLTIPLNKSVLVNSGAQIKKSSLDRLFRELKDKKNRKKNRSQIYQEVGIALAKIARIPAQPGKFYLKNKVIPKVDVYYLKEVMAALNKAF